MSDSDESKAPHEDAATQDHDAAQVSPAETAPAEFADVVPPIAALLATIRAGLGRGASADLRAAGANACRSVLAVLDAKPGQPLAVPPPSSSSASPIAALLSQPGVLSKLAAMTREQLLDLVKQTAAALTQAPRAAASAGPRFHLIQLPQVRPPGTAR